MDQGKGCAAVAEVALGAAIDLPQHLERPKAGVETVGTLARRKGRLPGEVFWEIKGDPQAVLFAKRIFPGSEGLGKGVAKFPATPRAFADLVWFMQRWPLAIEDPETWERDYQAACRQAIRRIELNRAPVRTLPPPVFTGTLKPFQEEGLSWMMTNRRTLLADEMGLGKTPTALAFMAAAAEWPALVVVPPHLVIHWEHKAKEFLTVAPPTTPLCKRPTDGTLQLHTIRGLKPYDLPDAHIYVIHYLLLRAWRQALKEAGIRTVVFDEVQELRHAGTEKYSAASDLSSLADNCVGLSGTPIYNRGAEIWTVMNAVDFHCLGDRDSFTREWCCGYGGLGKAAETIQDPDLLGSYLRREGLMIRRRKDDVLQELPSKRRVVQDIESDHGTFRELVKTAVRLAKDAAKAPDILTRGRLERDAIKETRTATGVAKAPAVAAFVRGLLEADEPVLLFAHHHAVMDILMDELSDCHPVRISGRESSTEKDAAITAFASGKTNLCLISLRSATGLDGLQGRARVVVFGELDWSPAVHSQGEDRAHRMGLKDSVLCYYLVTPYGTDPDIQEALGLKVSQFVGIMGDPWESEADRNLAGFETSAHMRRVIERLQAMHSA